MLTPWKYGAGLLALLAFAGVGRADDAAPPKFYRLDFIVKAVEGSRVLNSRTYSTIVSTENGANVAIRTGTKVPIQNGTSYTYADVGVNIDCNRVHETEGGLALNVSADLSSLPPEATNSTIPVIRQNSWRSPVIVQIRKPTVLFSSDDLTSKQQMQLELTATPIH